MRFDISIDQVSFNLLKKEEYAERFISEESRIEFQVADLVFFHCEDDDYAVIKTEAKVYKDGLHLVKTGKPYLVDGHMHLEYGPLNEEYVLEFVKAGVEKGLDEIDILDHTHRFKEFEPCYEHLKKYEAQSEWLKQPTKFCSRLPEYYDLISRVRKMDLPIRVCFGLEVCYSKNTEELLKEILKDVKLDFLTGAIHSFDSILYDMSFSAELFEKEKLDADQIVSSYYEAVNDCLGSGLFDRLAHPDQIKMIGKKVTYDLKKTYEQIADNLLKADMYAENNTGAHYRYHLADIGLNEEMLNIFKKKGVRMICASDAHKPADVGSYIAQATYLCGRN